MIRILGFLIGSAISVYVLLLLLGIPDFHLSNEHLDEDRFDEVVDKLREKQAAIVTERHDNPQLDKAVETTELPETSDDPAHDSVAETAAESTVDADRADDIRMAETGGVVVGEPQWHAFWNPFRSELAASGFVSQLERVTGMDYRVMKVKSGVYQVSFAYVSDEERRSKLTQISAATGLEFPDP